MKRVCVVWWFFARLAVISLFVKLGVVSRKKNQFSPLKARFFSPIRIDQYRPTVFRCNDGCSGFFFIYFVMVSLVFRALQVAMVEAQDEVGILPHHEGGPFFPASMGTR